MRMQAISTGLPDPYIESLPAVRRLGFDLRQELPEWGEVTHLSVLA